MIGTHTPEMNYISIKDGWFIKNNDHRNPFNIIGGRITECKIETYQSKSGQDYEFIKLVLTDTDGKFVLSIPVFNRLGRSFMVTCPNIDVDKVVEFYISLDKDGKDQMFYRQDGRYLKYYFTKDEPKGLPPYENIAGKWDNTRQISYLKAVLEQCIISKLVNPGTPVEEVPDFLDDFDPFSE